MEKNKPSTISTSTLLTNIDRDFQPDSSHNLNNQNMSLRIAKIHELEYLLRRGWCEQ